MQTFATTFQSTLQQTEQSRDPEPLVALFGEDCEILTVALVEPLRGVEGARKFWTMYLAAFEEIRSTFNHTIETEAEAVVEWIGEGIVAASGQPFNYRGICVLEYDGRRIHRFRSYYDSAVFLPGGAKHKDNA